MTTSGTTTRAPTMSSSSRTRESIGREPPGAAERRPGAEVGAGAQSDVSAASAAGAEPEPHLAGALRAAETARAVAARIRTTLESGSVPVMVAQGGRTAVPERSPWRGLSVAEAAAAATISFRPLSRPYGRLPHGAPKGDLKPDAAGCTIHHPPRPDAKAASTSSEATMPRCLARTIAELEGLRQSAQPQTEQPQVLPMSTRV